MKRLGLTFLLFLIYINTHLGQNPLVKTLASLPNSLKETSGLEITGLNSLWSNNDDTYAILYNFDTTGNIIKTVHLNNKNRGWEDLTQDETGNIYIGGFGNNKNDKTDLKILKIKNPENITDRVTTAEIINYTYEDQTSFPPSKGNMNFDMDAMTYFNDSLYLFSKNRTSPFNGYTKIYSLPASPGSYKAKLIDSVYLCSNSMLNCWVTAADISPDKKKLVLLSHDKIWLLTCFEDNNFATAGIQKIDLNHFSHKAAICFINNQEVYITDEKEMGILGGKLYKVDLSKWTSKSCQ